MLLVRASRFTLAQPPVAPLAPLALDETAAVAQLAGALRIPTVSRGDPPHRDPAAFEALHAHLRASFPLTFTRLSTEAVGQFGLLFTWKGTDPSKRPILLMAHQDVVPVDEPSAWTHPPFAGELADGYLWGRGALDVKSGLIGILQATEQLAREGFTPARTLYLAFGHDEEIGGEDGAKQIAHLLESRGVRLEMVLDEGAAIVEGVVPDVSVPVALIGVVEKGYLSLELSTKTEGGHSSMPPARTAIGRIAAAVARVESDPFPPRLAPFTPFLDYVGPKMPFAKRIVFANMWLFEPLVARLLSAKPTTAASIHTTTAPTIFRAGVKDNVLPHQASAVINFRIIPGETPETVTARVRALVDDPEIDIRPYGGFGTAPSPISSTQSEAYRALAETIRRVYPDPNLVVAPSLVVGATDSRYFQPIADDVYRFLFVHLGPDDIPRIHGTDERISVENHLQAIRFYYALIQRMQ